LDQFSGTRPHTGDAYLGDVDATCAVEGADGRTEQITIHHRGQLNAMTVLRWVYANVPAPSDIFVGGTSAGSMATPFPVSVVDRATLATNT
jgi:carboxylesterase type B